jgi:phosphatidylglycerol:prolipoprotein diacylglycerol transferase
MASHGGIVGMLIAIVHFARRHRLDAWHLLDLACLTGPIGLFLGRIANFINGELYGRPCSPNLSWGVKFAKEVFAWDTMDLARLAPAAQIVGTPQREWLAMLDNPQEHQPQIAGILNAITVGIEDNVRPVVAAVEPILTPRYPSQLIQAGLEGLLVLFLLALIWTRPRKPGVVAGWFVVLYAVARIAGEQFRMPDTDIGFELFGLTRGQELSILMLLVGVGVVLLAVYRQADKRPGWIGPMTDSSAKKLDRDQAHVVS